MGSTSYHQGMFPSAAAVDYTQEAPTYAQKCWSTIDSYYNLVDLVNLNREGDLTVLDACCGVGHIGVLASIKLNSPKNVYFIDINKAMLDQAFANMRALWGADMDGRGKTNFARVSIVHESQVENILKAFDQSCGFDFVFAKNVLRQYKPDVQRYVLQRLKSLTSRTGMLLCDVPHFAISRATINPNPGELTWYATREMEMVDDHLLPSDLSGWKHGRASFAIGKTNALLRKADVEKAEAEATQLAHSAGFTVYRSGNSFKLGKSVDQVTEFWAKAVLRTTLVNESVAVRADAQRREWVVGSRNQQPAWANRRIELPLTIDVALAQTVTIPLSAVTRVLPRAEARKVWRDHKKAG